MEHFLGSVEEHLGALLRFGTHADMRRSRPGTGSRGKGEGEGSEGLEGIHGGNGEC